MCKSPAETGLYYLQSRYYDPEVGRFINADAYASTGQGILGCNMFAYCGNNPVNIDDDTGNLWNTIIGTVAGAFVGGITACVMGTDFKAGVISGAINGAITGIAVDLAIATCGASVACFTVTTVFGGLGGAASSYVNQRMNGIDPNEIDWKTVAIDGMWGAVGAAVTYGVADVGGSSMQSFKEIFKQSRHQIEKQAGKDFLESTIISAGTWLNGTKMNCLLR